MEDNENMTGMEETPETGEQQEDSFLGGWDETETDLEDEPAPEGDTGPQEEALQEEGHAGEPTGEETEPQDNAEPQADNRKEETPPPQPRAWNLQHQGQNITVLERDAPGLMQKGLAYEQLAREMEEVSPALDLLRSFAEKANRPLGAYIGDLRAQAKQAEGMSAEEARRAVELEDRERRIAVQENAARQQQAAQEAARRAQAQNQERIARDVREFAQVYPDAARDYGNIPQEVWAAVDNGSSLVAAYAGYVNRKSAEEARAQAEENARQEAVKAQNQANARRSAGSMRSAGGDTTPKDPFAQGFDEG